MDEDFQLHLRHLHADLLDLVQGQLSGENDPGQAHLMPELHRGPVDRVGLHRQVDRHLGEGLARIIMMRPGSDMISASGFISTTGRMSRMKVLSLELWGWMLATT